MKDNKAEEIVAEFFQYQENCFVMPEEKQIKAFKTVPVKSEVENRRIHKVRYIPIIAACLAIIVSIMSVIAVLELSENNDLYIVSLNGNAESDIFKTSAETHASDKIIKTDVFDIPVEKELKIGNYKTTANLVKSEHFENFTRNTYLSADDTVKYVENTDSTFFQILAQNNAVLSHMDDDELTEEKLVKNIKEYIGGILGDIDYNKYTYSCSTFFVVDSEKGSHGDTRDGFVVSEKENEKVKSYTVKFAIYCNEIETINQITINCDEEGNITNFWGFNYDVDWESVKIDQEKVMNSIAYFIQNNTLSKYKVIGFEIESQLLAVKNGEVKLSVTAELMLTADGDNEWPMLCSFIIDL